MRATLSPGYYPIATIAFRRIGDDMPRKNSTMLTERAIERLPKAPPGKRVEKFDAGQPGLAIRVTETSNKSWSAYFHIGAKHRRITLGNWPAVSVKAARERTAELREYAKAGVDPKNVIVAERRAKADAIKADAAAGRTFGEIAELYIGQGMRQLAERTRRENEAMIRNRLIPRWGDVPFRSLTVTDANALFNELLDAGTEAAAVNTYKLVKRLGRWAEEKQYIRESPFTRLTPPAKYRQRDRILTHAEIVAVWQAAGNVRPPFGPFVRFLMLTGQRRTETARMRWRDVDLDTREWTIPAAENKSGRAHIVPLPAAATEILDAMPRFTRGDFVWTTTSGRAPMSGFSKMKARLDNACGVVSFTLHDMRRTARSEWARLGVPEIVAERLLNHAPKGLSAIYNRHQYAVEKRVALDKWAAALRDIVEPAPDNVVQMTEATA